MLAAEAHACQHYDVQMLSGSCVARRGKPGMEDILLAFDKSLEAIGRLDPDRTLFRACRVCLLRLPDSPPAPDAAPAGSAPVSAAAVQVDPKRSPSPAISGGNSRDGWDGRVLRADGCAPVCTTAVADAALASAAAERITLAGWIAVRLGNDVSRLALLADLHGRHVAKVT